MRISRNDTGFRRAYQASLIAPTVPPAGQSMRFTSIASTARLDPGGTSYTVPISEAQFAQISLGPRSLSPPDAAKEVSCTCGAITRTAFPGYDPTEAKGCELTQGEKEYCERTGERPSEYNITNCRGKSKRIAAKDMYLSKRAAILRGSKVSPTSLSQDDINFFHVDDLNGTKFGDPEEWDQDSKDGDQTERCESADQNRPQKAESRQDLAAILEDTHRMRPGFSGGGKKVTWNLS
jgi:hypothetical protein